jgi:hypothetical protein
MKFLATVPGGTIYFKTIAMVCDDCSTYIYLQISLYFVSVFTDQRVSPDPKDYVPELI